MTRLHLVLGDQLSHALTALSDLGPDSVVLMVEVDEEARYVPHHKQKITLILSAMRHFGEGLRAQGHRVDYVALDDPANTHSFSGEVARAVKRHGATRLIATEPGEWRVWQMMTGWQADLGLPVDIREDTRFFCSRAQFAALSQARKTSRMEYFYREMRRQSGLLMAGDSPVGGQWNFDSDNRKPLPKGAKLPPRLRFVPDDTTRAVMALVAQRFGDSFGDLEPFGWPVTRDEALQALDHFVAMALPHFGDVQDAMKAGEDFLYHSLLSPALNCGLLLPREVCVAAEAAYAAGHAPLNAVEGFIRQILGWREFVRGIYWDQMPGYAATNGLDADRALPDLYWTGETKMRCMAEAVGTTRRTGYAHHIQRLMVTGNFALLAGLAPAEVEAWYLAVYVDAYEWVELPNTHGMVLHADAGRIGSKPYAASGAYINRMSDYCGGCAYDVKEKLGPKACPFNYLYWDFIARHEARFANNPRMAMPVRTLRGMDADKRAQIREEASRFLDGLPPSGPSWPRRG
ncbi:cryptochrome/photolyase family protein [Tabrizicola sp.]|uniref:cryptochrome/photolyase family protein n=1 Tax=Tabrizicola sp. TaxID=2005166 RepID=UPI003D2BA237